MTKKIKYLRVLLSYTLILCAVLIYILVSYKNSQFGDVGIDELKFYMLNGLSGSNVGTFSGAVANYIPVFITLSLMLILPTINIYDKNLLITTSFKIRERKASVSFYPSRLINRCLLIYAIVILVSSIIFAGSSLHLYKYLISMNSRSNFIEKNYIDPREAKLDFPAKKRNLIYIYMESMENTMMSKANGGSVEDSIIPELETLYSDKNNVTFNNDDSGGEYQANSTSWTVGGMVAQSSGIPIASLPSLSGNELGKLNGFLPGAYTLGDVLKREGYYQEIMMGSAAIFGGRDKYYAQHGSYKIYDYDTAIKKRIIPKDYSVWWGFEDKKLFEYAKDELSTISEGSQPFNFQLLTADTHFVDGYLDPSCEQKYDSKYKNVYACASKQIYDFVNWIKEQDFYNNTTIILSGDHVGMQTSFYKSLSEDNYVRKIYNVIINSPKVPSKNTDRRYTPFDLYPTTLASLNVKINGEQLGLGVNLFSDKKTLLETYGLSFIDDELGKRSNFYIDNILVDK